MKNKTTLHGYTFMAPAIILLGIFVVFPIFFALFLSLNKVYLLGGMHFQFRGLSNYRKIFLDSRVLIAFENTFRYVIIVVPCQTILALILAASLNAGFKCQKAFRILFFLPTLTSSAVLTLIFMWMYNQNGLINHFLAIVHLPTYDWLGNPKVSLIAIMIMNIWSTAPFFMVIYLAAMQDIPKTRYEAAEIDGCGAFKKFLYITIPALKPITAFVVIMGIIGTFQLFDQSFIFSGGTGGPNNSTLTVVLLVYQYAFENFGTMGCAAALAFILAIVILIATLIQRRLMKED